MKRTHIIGTGSYIPSQIIENVDFHSHKFYSEDESLIDQSPEVITQKFQDITGIHTRRYAAAAKTTSDISVIAAQRAIKDAGIDPETLDQIIVAHNFGDVKKNTIQSDAVPSLASRVKHALKIQNPNCVAFDLLFGCPGWVQGVIHAHAFFKAGMASKALVIGAETLSRVIDDFDRDSMIFSDGAGACVLSYDVPVNDSGILSIAAMSHTTDEAYYIFMGKSNLPNADPNVRYIKMKGRKVYEYALTHVPTAMKNCLDSAGISIHNVKKVFIHQANEKLDEGVIKRLYKLYDVDVPDMIMPMSVHELGNSSVATVPTLIDRVLHNQVQGHSIQKGDVALFASVGAGMNINAICYRF